MRAIEFFIYSRAARTAAGTDDPALNEEHWSYMDAFAAGMIARGPTLGADRATWTGSLHIVDLPNLDAAREFVEREPYNRAGLFERHLIRRFRNVLGRSMWEFPQQSVDPRFLVIAHLRAAEGDQAPAGMQSDLLTLQPERLIVHGELLTADEAQPAGVAFALHAPTREHVDALLRDARAHNGERFELEILDWEFGGRR